MKSTNLIVFLFISIVITEVSKYTVPIKPPVVLYVLTYICLFVLIILALINRTEFTNFPRSTQTLFKLYWLYSLFIIVYGLVDAHSYWDYKHVFISYATSVVLSLVIFAGFKLEQNINLFKFIIKIAFPFALFLSFFVWFSTIWSDYDPVIYHPAITRMSIPVFFFILAFPFLKLKQQWLVLFLSIVCLYVSWIGLTWRANIFRITACWIIVLFYYLPLLKPRIINRITFLIFFAPLIFLYLGIEGTLDIFQLASQSEVDIDIDKSNTRTFLFEEVFWSTKEKGTNFLFGGGASAGYQTNFFKDPLYIVSDKGRFGTEVAFLNSYLKSGLIGVTLDMLIVFLTAYFAVNRSNNNFSKMLGMYLIFHWLLYFLEVPRLFDIYYFFFYLIIGLCLSKSFRESTDTEVKYFFKSI